MYSGGLQGDASKTGITVTATMTVPTIRRTAERRGLSGLNVKNNTINVSERKRTGICVKE